jgi:hypothetical protein
LTKARSKELIPLAYKELRDVARHHLQRERPGHSWQSAAPVHEAYLGLVEQRRFDTENRPISWRWQRAIRQMLGNCARALAPPSVARTAQQNSTPRLSCLA